VHLDYRKIFSLCLDGNVKPALEYITLIQSGSLSLKDQGFKSAFEKRFRYDHDQEGYRNENYSAISGILQLYRDYWRTSLLDSSANRDSLFIEQLGSLLGKKYGSVKQLSINTDSLDEYLRKYIMASGYMTTGFGKTGKLYDLLVWQKQEDTVYIFTTGNEKIRAHVIFMDDFVTLGWEQYATLDNYYPGGWANDSALFCVKKAYDLHSEIFLISYLAHEGRHMADYKLFPKLTSADLEYRGKMTELSLADTTLYSLINFFIANANYNSENGHSIADYCVIRDLSISLFNKEYISDQDAWKKITVGEIHEAAKNILAENTKSLHALGSKAGDSIYIKRKYLPK
jgi:hypothetical protein